jgi:hypothetical protein
MKSVHAGLGRGRITARQDGWALSRFEHKNGSCGAGVSGVTHVQSAAWADGQIVQEVEAPGKGCGAVDDADPPTVHLIDSATVRDPECRPRKYEPGGIVESAGVQLRLHVLRRNPVDRAVTLDSELPEGADIPGSVGSDGYTLRCWYRVDCSDRPDKRLG